MAVPKIRFPGFTDAWEQRKLGDVIEIESGMDYKSLNPGDIPVYGTGGYMLSVDKALSYERDAIGIGRKGTIDKPYILKAPFWTVDTLFYCIPKENYSLNFVHCIFQKINWKKKDESTGVPSLSKTIIKNIPEYFPSLSEQKKLGKFFSSLDDTITLHQRKLESMKLLKKSLLQKMFPKSGETVPEVRFPGFTDAWEQRKLGELGTTYTGISGKTSSDFGHGDARFITYMNVYSNAIANPLMVEPIEIDQKQNEVKVGDVFFTTSSETPDEVGMSSVLLEKQGTVYLNSFCFGYRPKEKIDLHYLAFMLRSEVVRKKIIFLAQGISRYNISKNKMMEISVPLPTIEEQSKIGGFLNNLDNLITLHQRELICRN